MHCNENADRSQAMNQAGNAVFVIRFPKYKKGVYTMNQESGPYFFVWIIIIPLSNCQLWYTFGPKGFIYIYKVTFFGKVLHAAWEQVAAKAPETLTARYEWPNKAEVVKAHTYRFIKQKWKKSTVL